MAAEVVNERVVHHLAMVATENRGNWLKWLAYINIRLRLPKIFLTLCKGSRPRNILLAKDNPNEFLA
jgi:hypothetical protein